MVIKPEIPSKKASTNAVAPTFSKKSRKKIPNTSLLVKLLESKFAKLIFKDLTAGLREKNWKLRLEVSYFVT